ncbi:hypothetical protein OWR29_39965 [Actinoplanes sp. Pm04-4]|uniref:Uncharacterized protein n=1 Tax=Paractinoplanes pyxinae TaxID=2997416 RepID=A0ABT4BCG9_9ACTN|nr:hypothetical protein [Actinoplanes pyxinae]MCY1144206.1 hypothetical protein [Actinoplanes pyxinae]
MTTILVGVGLVLADDKLSTGTILSSIGLNLIASVIFATVFTVLLERVQQRSIDDNIRESMNEATAALVQQVSALGPMFIPAATYSNPNAAHRFQSDFNLDLTTSMTRTMSYGFRGPSAWYLATRLQTVAHKPQQVKVIILDPSNPRAVAKRAVDQSTQPHMSGLSPAAMQDLVRTHLAMAITALFDCRHICPIEMVYDDYSSVYRYEFTDDALFLTWLHNPASGAAEFPPAFRFSADSFLYQTLRLEFLRKFEISQQSVVFQAERTDQFLIEHLSNVLGNRVTQEDLTRWRHDYAVELDPFKEHLRSLNGS